MSDAKPRLTHMMIDAVNDRVSDTRKMVSVGIFMTLAFSAATFGLTLGAAEFSKEEHVTDVQGMPVKTTIEGDFVYSNPVATHSVDVEQIVCQNQAPHMVTEALSGLETYRFAEAGSYTSMKVSSVSMVGNKVTINGMGGESHTIDLAKECTEAGTAARKLLQYGSSWPGSGSSSGGSGGGSGSGSGSGCDENGEKEDGSILELEGGSLASFYAKPTGVPNKMELMSLGGLADIDFMNNGHLQASMAGACKNDDWDMDFSGSAGIDIDLNPESKLMQLGYSVAGTVTFTLDADEEHKLSLTGSASGHVDSDVNLGWAAKYTYQRGAWHTSDDAPPRGFKIIAPSELSVGVGGDFSGGTTVTASIGWRF